METLADALARIALKNERSERQWLDRMDTGMGVMDTGMGATGEAADGMAYLEARKSRIRRSRGRSRASC